MIEEGHRILSNDFHEAYRLLCLIRAFILKKLSAKEREELDAWLEQSDENIDLFEKLTDDGRIPETLALYEQLREDDTLRRLKNRIPFVAPRSRVVLPKLWLSAAAMFVGVVGIGLYFYLRPQEQANKPPVATTMPVGIPAERIFPGGNKAVLITESGSQIVLDTAANGRIRVETNEDVEKSNGQISYANGNEANKVLPVTHTLITPKGGQYQVTLSDGTKVWLNAASSLKYPIVFVGNERTVELTGEGYFEVAHSTKTFRVKLASFTVEDIGTAFNINTYKDEGFDKTTLTEGSAKVIGASTSKTLVRGQQAQVEDGRIEVMPADVDAVKGWMNGKFVYRFTPLNAVLKDLERWYNIKVDNEQKSASHLKATIDRNVPLSQIIKILEVTADVKLKWDGTKLTVLP